MNFAVLMLLPVMAGQVSGQQQNMNKDIKIKQAKPVTIPDNTLSVKEKNQGWNLLLDGK